MADDRRDYGILLNGNNLKLHRNWFKQLVRLQGIQVIYYAPAIDKSYTQYTEIAGHHYEPIGVGCIFDEHPDQKSLKKMGWVAELQESESIIHVPYDLPRLQRGALFLIPDGLDTGKGRLFRVNILSNIMVYPASIACSIVPEYASTFAEQSYEYTNTDFNLLNEG